MRWLAFPSPGIFVRELATADLDVDGRTDAVIIDGDARQAYLLYGRGEGFGRSYDLRLDLDMAAGNV